MKKYLLLFIIILAFVLRFYQLGKNPPSPDWDEVALGYNAYSILKTGRDEYGQFLPLTFRSFDDYKPPLYVYLTIPSVAIFGLNEFAVRFPSALLGVLTVILVYFLVKELFRDSKNSLLTSHLPVLTSLFLAVSPWHLQFSRLAFETNIALFLNVFGAFLFLKGTKQGKFLLLSAVFFSLALYTYHSARVFTPLLVLGLAFIFRNELLKLKKYVLLAAIFSLIILTPIIQILATPEGRLRAKGVSIFFDITGLLARDIVKIEDDQKMGFPLGKIIHNRRITYGLRLTQGYLSHFSLRWLFLSGDLERHHAPDMGILYLWEFPFILIGIFLLTRQKIKGKWVVFWWFLIAPIAASPTTQLPHAIRTLSFLPTWQIFTALGIIQTLLFLKVKFGKRKTLIFTALAFLFFIFNFLYYLHMYFVHMPLEYSQEWQYGRKEAVSYVKENYNQYAKIVVSTKLEQPHMFFLFYLKYDPAKYLAEGGTASGGFAEWRNKFDKYEFRPIEWSKEIKDGKILYVGMPQEFPGGINTLKTIYYLDGEEAIKIVEKI